ncbi:MAG: four helix bundle protein [bacterium]|nr:four helix bundle protein [bacterium]
MKKYDLHERLIDFSVLILEIVEKMPRTYTGVHLSKQLVRSGTAPALHHAEAQSAESAKDFIHKMKIALKELRETYVNLKIIKQKPVLELEIISKALYECNELISIFVKSIQTARKNAN